MFLKNINFYLPEFTDGLLKSCSEMVSSGSFFSINNEHEQPLNSSQKYRFQSFVYLNRASADLKHQKQIIVNFICLSVFSEMEVNCKFDYSGSHYWCYVDSISITQRNIEIKAFKGEHGCDQNNNNVVAILFNNKSNVEFFPKGLLHSFPHLTRLTLFECGLKSICREDLEDFHNLELLHVPYNQLTTLHSDLFIDKPKLQDISFLNNDLEFVSSHLFTPIIKNGLISVNFENNRKISAYYSSNSSNEFSLKQFMNLIDTQCSKPPGEENKMTDDTHKDKCHKGIADLWIFGHFSDFTIIAKDSQEFHVHKNILGFQSSVLAAIFETDIGTCEMKILDFSPSAVEQFLGFIYTGSVPDDINAMELFAIAAKYNVFDLKMLSEKMILKTLCKDNVLEVFNLGHLYSSDVLKLSAFRMIQEMFPGKVVADHLINKPEDV